MKLVYGLLFIFGFSQLKASEQLPESSIDGLLTYLQTLHKSTNINANAKVSQALDFLKKYEEERVVLGRTQVQKCFIALPVKSAATPKEKSTSSWTGKKKQEKVIKQNLDILLSNQDRGKASKHYSENRKNLDVIDSVMETINSYSPDLERSDKQEILERALYYNLNK